MTATKPDVSLEEIRREIDDIDDGLLHLLRRRFVASAMVRARKKAEGSLAVSPLRPAREAQMLRRLISARGSELPPHLLVRLWRVILSASAQAQAVTTVHVDSSVSSHVEQHVAIASHFCGMAISSHADLVSCLAALAARHGDLAVVQVSSSWADWLRKPEAGGVRVIGTLPAIASGAAPELLVLGHLEAAPSGDDETILIGPEEILPTASGYRWHARSGTWHAIAIEGFCPAVDVERNWPGFMLAGCCPKPFEANR
jgi:chorismate mutase